MSEKTYLDDYSHLNIGDEYKGKIIESLSPEGHPCAGGRNLVRNTFLKGNKFAKGRVKGSRNKLTQQMLDMVASARITPAEYLMDVMEMVTADPKERLAAAMKLADFVYPKAASVEVDIKDNEELSKSEIDALIAEKLSSLSFKVSE